MSTAPIALFAYNRPEHLKRTVDALAASPLAASSPLVVFSDAPKRPEHASGVAAVRTYLATLTGFASIRIVERTHNLGLAKSIIDGVTKLSEAFGRVIVVEDDLVVAPEFLQFMNHALERYAPEPRVMQVSGYMYPVSRPSALPDFFFLHLPTSWGWGTWRRAWERFESDAGLLMAKLEEHNLRYAFDFQGNYPFFETLAAQAKGELDVWGVRWYASTLLADGLCLYPARAFVHNAGMDGSGLHCGSSQSFDVDITRARLGAFPAELRESAAAAKQIAEFFGTLKEPGAKRVLRRLAKRVLPALGWRDV